MKKLMSYLFLALMLFGGGYVVSHFDLDQTINIGEKGNQQTSTTTSSSPKVGTSGSITIASFNIQVFGQSKLNKPQVMEVLADTVRRFDVVAIQEIRSSAQDVMPRFVSMINADGSQYDFAISPRLGRTTSKEQYAFVYNTQTVELDRNSLYVVNDPQDMLHREPFVAGFRARGVDPREAFTFTLVNIHTDPDETDQELSVLDDVIYAVRNDGRREDDVILLGDLNVDESGLGDLGRMPGITWVIRGQPTNTRKTKLYDNIVFDLRATKEFQGRSGVLDLMAEYRITTDQALEVSDHLPIWAEFSNTEGGVPGRIAAQPPTNPLPR